MSKPKKPPKVPPLLSPEQRDYQKWIDSLPEEDRRRLQGSQEPEEHESPWEPKDARWWLVEYADGELAVAKGYAKLEVLAKRFRQIDGGDTSAQIFLGQPVAFSQGQHRVLFLPDGRGFSLTHGRMLSQEDPLFHEELAVQEDGFLGPPDLAISTPPPRTGQTTSRPEELDDLEPMEELPEEKEDDGGDEGESPVEG